MKIISLSENELFSINYNNEDDTIYKFSVASPTPPEQIHFLTEHGFYLADRLQKVEIPLKKMKSDLHRMVRFDIKTSGITAEEVYELAKDCFTTDRRFHPQIDYDQENAAKLIHDYICEKYKRGCLTAGVYYKGEMIGFNCFTHIDTVQIENVLGAVSEKYRRTGAAVSLYAGAALYLAELGYEKLIAYISSANTASLNMHFLLGNGYSVVTEAVDVWYYNKQS